MTTNSQVSPKAADALRYNLGCFECLDGNIDEASILITQHLQRRPDLKEYAKTDPELASIRTVIEML